MPDNGERLSASNETSEMTRIIESFGLSSQIDRINRSLGNPVELPDEDVTEVELQRWEEEFLARDVLMTFEEFSTYNQILWRRKAVQHLARIEELQKIENRTPEQEQELIRNRQELVVANQARTYNEYLPAVVRQVTSFMSLFEAELQTMIDSLPEAQRTELLGQYRQCVAYLNVLKTAIDERRNFANVRNIDAQVAQLENELGQDNTTDMRKGEIQTRLAELRRSRETIFSQLPEASQQNINASQTLYRIWFLTSEIGQLETSLADSTDNTEKTRIETEITNKKAERGRLFATLPQAQQDALQPKLAGSSQELQVAILQQHSQLKTDHTAALDERVIDILKGNPEGKDIGIEQNFLPQRLYLQAIQLRYNQLHSLQTEIARNDWEDQYKQDVQAGLSVMRTEYMNNMISATQQMAAYHQAMAEMATIQNQFRGHLNLDGAREPIGETPAEILAEVDKSVDGARDFHLGRLEAMLDEVNKSFSPNGFEELKDAGIMELLENVDWLSSGIRNLITAALPEGQTKEQIDSWLDTNLPLSLQESLETGVGPDGEPLTKEEKLQKIRDVIIAFRDTESVKNYKTTVDLIQGMPDVSTYAGQVVTEPLPALPQGGIRTVGQRDQLLEQHNGATVYAMLIEQMRQDSEAFHTAYEKFLGDMEQLVNIRLSLIVEVNNIRDSWRALATALTAATGAAIILPWVAGGAATAIGGRMLWRGMRAVPKLIKAPGAIARAARGVPGLAGRAAGSAALAYRAYQDYEALVEQHRSIEQQRVQMIADLRAAGFEADPVDQEVTYVYKDGGTEVKVNINEVHEAQEGQETAQALRMISSGTMALVVLRYGIGRTFLPLIAVEVGVEITRYGIDQAADRKFLTKAPAWLLAKINLEQATGDTAYELLVKTSGEMMTDAAFNDGENSAENKNKREIRRKLLFSLFHNELRQFPAMEQEIYGGSSHPFQLEKFFAEEGGFHDIVLPYFYVRLYRMAGNSLTWEEISDGKVDEDWNIPLPSLPDVSLVQIRAAMRESMVFYVQHSRERMYLDAHKEKEELTEQLQNLANAESDEAQELRMRLDIVNDVLATLGQQVVLGTKLADLNVDRLVEENYGETRAQRILLDLSASASIGSTNYRIDSDDIEGISSDIDFSNSQDVYRLLLPNPGDQQKFQLIGPRTIEEPEGSVDARWVHNFVRPFLGPKPFGLTYGEVERRRVQYAADTALRRLGVEDERLRDPLFFRDGQEDLSGYELAVMISKAGLLLSAQRREERASQDRIAYRRSGNGVHPIYYRGASEVTSRGVNMDSVYRREGFSSEQRLAVYNDSFKIDGVGLAEDGGLFSTTVVYGDPTDIDKMYVVQKTDTRVDVGDVERQAMFLGSESYRERFVYVEGQPVIMSAADFIAHQPGGRSLLEDVMRIHREYREEERRQNQQQYERLREENKEAVVEVMESARNEPGTWKQLPFGESYKYVAYSEQYGFMYLDMLEDDRVNHPSIGAAPEQSRIERRSGRPPVEIVTTSGRYFLGRDYRTFFEGRDVDRTPYEQALTYPLANDRSSLQMVLTVYLNINSEVCEDAERSLLPIYRKMANTQQKQLFLRTLNNMLQERTGARAPRNWSRVLDDIVRDISLELASQQYGADVLEYDGVDEGTYSMQHTFNGVEASVTYEAHSRSKRGGILYQPNRETDSFAVTYRNADGSTGHYTVWGYRFFASGKYPLADRQRILDVLTTPNNNNIPWHNMEKIVTRFPHNISYTRRLYESLETTYVQALDKQTMLRALFEETRDNGAQITADTWQNIRDAVLTRARTGEFDRRFALGLRAANREQVVANLPEGAREGHDLLVSVYNADVMTGEGVTEYYVSFDDELCRYRYSEGRWQWRGTSNDRWYNVPERPYRDAYKYLNDIASALAA